MFALFLASATCKTGKCNVCITATEQVQKLAKFIDDHDKLLEEAQKICILFKGSRKEQCDIYMKSFLPIAIQFIDQAEPAQICQRLKLCRATKVSLPKEPFHHHHQVRKEQTNAAVTFAAETSPDWSISWEEPIDDI